MLKLIFQLKTRAFHLSMIMLLLTALSACGSGGGGDDPPTTGNPPVTDTPPVDDPPADDPPADDPPVDDPPVDDPTPITDEIGFIVNTLIDDTVSIHVLNGGAMRMSLVEDVLNPESTLQFDAKYIASVIADPLVPNSDQFGINAPLKIPFVLMGDPSLGYTACVGHPYYVPHTNPVLFGLNDERTVAFEYCANGTKATQIAPLEEWLEVRMEATSLELLGANAIVESSGEYLLDSFNVRALLPQSDDDYTLLYVESPLNATNTVYVNLNKGIICTNGMFQTSFVTRVTSDSPSDQDSIQLFGLDGRVSGVAVLHDCTL